GHSIEPPRNRTLRVRWGLSKTRRALNFTSPAAVRALATCQRTLALEAVFPLANDGKYFHPIQLSAGPAFRGVFHTIPMAAQEWIHIPLPPYVRGHRCLIPRAPILAFLEVLTAIRVVRLDRQGEFQVVHGVFVPAVHLRLFWQGREFVQRGDHL